MIFLLLLPVLYLFIGAFLARRDYANRVALAADRDVTKELKGLRAKRKDMVHTITCWRGPTYRSTSEACDCQHRTEWAALTREISRLEADGIVVGGPYKMLFGWPVLSLDAFLKGGKPPARPGEALRPKEWEEKMEKDLLELESFVGELES